MLNNIDGVGAPGASRNSDADSIALPAVIRPVPVELRAVEHRLLFDASFAGALAARPDLASSLARAIFNRDPAARSRFRDHAELAGHLAGLRAG